METPANIQVGVETCDDGNTLTEVCGYGETSCSVCAADCLEVSGATSVCGDGILDTANGEECDDGNTDESDECLNTCRVATCGDGFTQSGVEECDDGNADPGDDCLNSCLLASCGDGFVQSGVEECDDQNVDNGDGCTNSCLLATCGDGFTQAGVEECDDANGDNGDGCLSGCLLATCGDRGGLRRRQRRQRGRLPEQLPPGQLRRRLHPQRCGGV
jgi:cysteine-rich repeat protein